MQLFQRRRWIDPSRLTEGLEVFVRQLAWIDDHTALSMAGWRRIDAAMEPGAILATTTYDDHRWFLDQVARLQTLDGYGPVNDATAALTIGEDTFERWDAPPGTLPGWTLPKRSFRQVVGPPSSAGTRSTWSNAEGATDLVTWLTGRAEQVADDSLRREDWARIH